MFRRPLMLLLLLSPALFGAGGWYFWPRPFEPRTASPRELCGWLVEHRVVESATELQAELYDRCRVELLGEDSTVDWNELHNALQSIRPEQRERWQENVRWWCQRWFINEAQAYAAVAHAQRAQYLSKQIAQWRTREFAALGKLRSAGTTNTAEGMSPARLAELSVEIETWIATAAPHERPLLKEFWTALRWQFLIQSNLWQGLRG